MVGHSSILNIRAWGSDLAALIIQGATREDEIERWAGYYCTQSKQRSNSISGSITTRRLLRSTVHWLFVTLAKWLRYRLWSTHCWLGHTNACTNSHFDNFLVYLCPAEQCHAALYLKGMYLYLVCCLWHFLTSLWCSTCISGKGNVLASSWLTATVWCFENMCWFWFNALLLYILCRNCWHVVALACFITGVVLYILASRPSHVNTCSWPCPSVTHTVSIKVVRIGRPSNQPFTQWCCRNLNRFRLLNQRMGPEICQNPIQATWPCLFDHHLQVAQLSTTPSTVKHCVHSWNIHANKKLGRHIAFSQCYTSRSVLSQ